MQTTSTSTINMSADGTGNGIATATDIDSLRRLIDLRIDYDIEQYRVLAAANAFRSVHIGQFSIKLTRHNAANQ